MEPIDRYHKWLDSLTVDSVVIVRVRGLGNPHYYYRRVKRITSGKRDIVVHDRVFKRTGFERLHSTHYYPSILMEPTDENMTLVKIDRVDRICLKYMEKLRLKYHSLAHEDKLEIITCCDRIAALQDVTETTDILEEHTVGSVNKNEQE